MAEEQHSQQYQERQNQRKREAEVDSYLSRYVFFYLLELAASPGPRRIDFEGQLFEYSQIIRAAIKSKLIQHPSLNDFTARHRVRQFVDDWIAGLMSEREREELQKRTLEVQRLALELQERQLQHDLQRFAEGDAKIKRERVEADRDASLLNRFARVVGRDVPSSEAEYSVKIMNAGALLIEMRGDIRRLIRLFESYLRRPGRGRPRDRNISRATSMYEQGKKWREIYKRCLPIPAFYASTEAYRKAKRDLRNAVKQRQKSAPPSPEMTSFRAPIS